jgi:hypothetical protein
MVGTCSRSVAYPIQKLVKRRVGVNSAQEQSMNSNTLPTSCTRLILVLAAITIVPALFLPFYQAFLRGGRGAVDIIPRSGSYAVVPMLGAFCILLAMFGLIVLYLRYYDQMGQMAPICFMLSILVQAFIAGLVFINGFYMPTLQPRDQVMDRLT